MQLILNCEFLDFHMRKFLGTRTYKSMHNNYNLICIDGSSLKQWLFFLV